MRPKVILLHMLLAVTVVFAGIGVGHTLNRSPLPSVLAEPVATTDRTWTTLISAATGTGTAMECSGATNIAVEYETSAGVSAGTVLLEHSAVSPFAGTWALLDTQAFTTATTKTLFRAVGPFGYVRPRFSVNATGGTITVRIRRLYQQ